MLSIRTCRLERRLEEFRFDDGHFSIFYFESSAFCKMSGKFTKAKQLFGLKPMSRRRQLSLAWSAIAKQTCAVVSDESDWNVD